MARVSAVSYTHLDVYKRQVQTGRNLTPSLVHLQQGGRLQFARAAEHRRPFGVAGRSTFAANGFNQRIKPADGAVDQCGRRVEFAPVGQLSAVPRFHVGELFDRLDGNPAGLVFELNGALVGFPRGVKALVALFRVQRRNGLQYLCLLYTSRCV